MKKTILNTTVLAAVGMVGTVASHAVTTYTGASFSNYAIVQDDATALVITADVSVGGVVVGALDASLTEVAGGTTDFTASSWSASGQLNATGIGSNPAGTDTAFGDWAFTITPIAGWQVDGISTFTNGAILGNPIYSNITSNGAATLQEDITGGLGAALTDGANGDSYANGSTLTFGIGTNTNGIDIVDHSNLWSLDFAGASTIGFRYAAGAQVGGEINNIGGEGIRIDASLSEAPPVPEPSAGLLAAFGGLLLLRRRR